MHIGCKDSPGSMMAIDLTFLSQTPPGTEQLMQILAAAESLTDAVAEKLYEIAPLEGVESTEFLGALRQTDLIEPRNSEWSFDPRVRHELLRSGTPTNEFLIKAHALLLEYTKDADPDLAGSVIPNYLFTKAGKAYHLAGSGFIEEARSVYAETAEEDYGGPQWLASKFAEEQINAGIFNQDDRELLFLRAIVLYREGKRSAAEPIFWRIIREDKDDRPAAFALNVLGNGLKKKNPEQAEELLRRGLRVNEAIGDYHGTGIAFHLLGNVIRRDPSRTEEVEDLYKKSERVFRSEENYHAAGQVLHSYGDFLSHQAGRSDEADEVLRRSIQYLSDTGDITGVGQTLNSLAKHLSRTNGYSEEAEGMLQRSISIAKNSGSAFDLARRLYSLGRLLALDSSRANEAANALRESLALNDEYQFTETGGPLIKRLLLELERDAF